MLPGTVDPAALRKYERFVRPVVSALWPTTLDGAENLPSHDDYVVVANHSGLGLVECVTLLGAWLERVGAHRRLAAMAHSSLFRAPLLGDQLRAVGAVEATREAAAHARRTGSALLLFPGGDHEAMRPIWRADEVDFGGRTGWIGLARELRLDIVPLAIRGSHVTIPNLGSSKALAWLCGPRLVGIHRMPLPVLSILVAAGILAATRGRGTLFRAGVASLGYASVALVPFVPSSICMRLLPRAKASAIATMSDADVYETVTNALRAAVVARA